MLVRLEGDVIQMGGPRGSTTWSDERPVSDLPGLLKLYRGLRDRDHGRFARFHADTVAGLERIAAELKARERGA